MMERWIRMQDGVVVTGPGPLPIRLPDANGDPVRATELTEDQINALGWYRVAQSRRAFDRRFEVETGPAFTLIDGEPTDVFSYSFRPGARQYMTAAIDQQAEFQRRGFITALPGQMGEYDEAVVEARACLDDYENGITPVAGQYAYLEADIGHTINPDTGQPVADIYEAAQVVLAMRTAFKAAGAEIRRNRLAAKAAIRAAGTDAEAMAIVHAQAPAVLSMFVLEPNSTHPYDAFNEVWNPNLAPLVAQ